MYTEKKPRKKKALTRMTIMMAIDELNFGLNENGFGGGAVASLCAVA